VLTGMMRWQMDHIRERGECLAALWASEAPIYGRFGYGLAAEGVEMTIDRTRTGLRHLTAFGGRTRFVTRDEALAAWPAIYDCVRLKTPGMISRPPHWWASRHLAESERPLAGYGKSFLVQYEEEGRPLGYVRYRIKDGYAAGSSTSTLAVVELMATTDAAYAALWSYVFGVDLIDSITTPWGRVDEPLQHMLADPRRLVRRPQDTLWVRLVDTATALASRRYGAKDAIVIAVDDAFCTWNTGTYLLEGGPDGARCTRSTAAPAVTLSAETLGAAYLGGTRFSSLARAGRVQGSDEDIRRADAMFAWDPRPWIPEIF
jgi:predicted acetyltransferase